MFITIAVMIFTALLMGPPTHALDVVVLRAARGYDARLPCGQGKVFLDGPRSYVVWLKDDKDFLYRFPEDESAPRSLDPNIIYGTTCKAGVCYDETSLLLKNVSDKDGGLYTCRVHYQASPSDEFMIEIRLVEPAGKPHIRTETGEAPENMNPISLGANLTLICFLVDGPKDAILYWERNGEPVQSYTSPGENGAVILLTNVTWAENMAKYECLAQNADVSLPFTTNFNLKMNLVYDPPTSWELSGRDGGDNSRTAPSPQSYTRASDTLVQPMEAHLSEYDPYWEADVSVQIQCSVFVEGIESPTIISWFINGAKFESHEYETEAKGQYVTSTLTFHPELQDDGNELICKARRPMLNLMCESRTTIHVGNRPTCASIESDEEDEASDSFNIKCVVLSVKRPLQFIWNYADAKTRHENIGATSNLVIKQDGKGRYYTSLAWKSKMSIGHLTCLARNKYGLQQEPCLYSILPISPPTTPHCDIERESATIYIDCIEGSNNEFNNTVYMELKNGQGLTVHNMSSTLGQFRVDGINIRRSYTVIIYASNLRGRSAKVIQHVPAIPIITTLTPSTEKEKWAKDIEITGWYQAVAQVVAFVLVISFSLIVTLVAAMIRFRRRDANNPPTTSTRSAEDGLFQREPDVVGDAVTTTNITVNQMPGIDNVQIQGARGYADTSLVQLGNGSLHTQVNTGQTRIQNTCKVSRAGAHYYV